MVAEPQAIPTPIVGLTEHEADERRRNGQGNDVALETSRSYVHILRQNIIL